MERTFLIIHSFKCWIRIGKHSVQAPKLFRFQYDMVLITEAFQAQLHMKAVLFCDVEMLVLMVRLSLCGACGATLQTLYLS